MSILPSSNSVSSSSSPSSSRSSQAPNFNHGYASSDLCTNTFSPTPSLGSLQIADSSNFSAGAVASDALISDTSSNEVIDLEASSDEIGSSSRSHFKISQPDAFEAAGVRCEPNESGHMPSENRDAHSASSARGISASSAGKKPQVVSGNHLLNFHYDPIPRSNPRPRVPPPRRWKSRKPYNKDLFLQANFKFVLLDTGNYEHVSLDPDKMLQWEDIVCVKYLTPLQVQCPICLDDPLCPQITSCGHIFCFPCILQYLMMGEDDDKGEYNKKCPLCFMMVSSKDLHTINIKTVKQHCVGDVLELMLLTRKRDSFALSLKSNESSDTDDQCKDLFSRFTFTSDVDLSVRDAFLDLNSWLARAESGLVDDIEKLPYVCAAIKQLEQRKVYWDNRRICNPIKANKFPHQAKASKLGHGAFELAEGSPSSNTVEKLVWSEKSTPRRPVNFARTSDVAVLLDDNDGISSSMVDLKDQSALLNGQSSVNGYDSYVFYQAVDGQHIILHPLNMKCLMQHYGNSDQLPNRISGKVLQLESVTQSEATRRRYRFLSHFSISTSFQFCEIDLSGSLPPEALSPFMHEIKNRDKERKRIARKEHRDKIKAESAGLEFMPVPFDFQQAPYGESLTFSMDDFEALGSSTTISRSPPPVGERQTFSSVAKLGFAAGHDSPSLGSQETRILPKTEIPRDSVDAPGSRKSGEPSFSSVTSRGILPDSPEVPKLNEAGKKGKKQNRVLLSTAGGRRY